MESVNKSTEEILLSICIPTYNRSSELNLCLESIVLQKGFDNRTEIVILDNNSSDNTFKIAEKYLSLYHNIKYYKNSENIGMEKNILKVLEYGNGKLLKLLNDYSLIMENMLDEIINQIIKNQNEHVILYFQNQKSKTSNIICTDLNCFYRATTYWPTWIGTFSIWKSDFRKYVSTVQFEGLLFPHLLLFLDVFEKKQKVKIVNGLFFCNLKGIKKGGYDFFEVFVGNFIGKIIHKAFEQEKINYITLYIVKSSFFNSFLKPWLKEIIYKNNHNFNKINFTLIFQYFKFNPHFYTGLIQLIIYPIQKMAGNIKKRILNN